MPCSDPGVPRGRLRSASIGAAFALCWLASASAQGQHSHAAPESSAERVQRVAEAGPFAGFDEDSRRELAAASIAGARRAGGGRSLAFKLWFAGGAQAHFKPEQSFAANWYSEVASYYLDRELGLGRVPPSIGRRVPWELLSSHADPQRADEAVIRDGVVRGSLVTWLDEPLVPLQLPDGWENWLRNEPASSPTPLQRVSDYLERQRRGDAPALPSPPAPDSSERPAELSDLIVFDYLIDNLDRWGGGFTNVRTLGNGGKLIYLDNANGFAPRRVPSRISQARLEVVQRFRASTIGALERLDLAALSRRMARDPLAPLLTAGQLRQLDARRRRVLAHVQRQRRRFGQAATPW